MTIVYPLMKNENQKWFPNVSLSIIANQIILINT